MKKTEENKYALTPRAAFLLLVVATLFLLTVVAIFVLDQHGAEITPMTVITFEVLGEKGPWLNFSHKSGDTLLLNDIKLMVFNKDNRQQIIIESISDNSNDIFQSGDTLSVMVNGDDILIQVNQQTIENPVVSESSLSGWSDGDEIEVSVVYEPSGFIITSQSQISTTDITPVEAPIVTPTPNPTVINIPVPTMTAVGVANPIAHGHAITRTATILINALVN